jgi:DNA polymerase beta
MSSDVKAKVLEALGVLLKQESVNKDVFKMRAYKKLIEELKSSPLPITSLQDVETIVPKISDKMKLKIKEIIETGGLVAAEKAKAELQLNAHDELGAIYGVGPVKAKDLIAKGIKTVAQLREAVMMDPSLLNEKQKIGLLYYEDILKRIPRSEMEQHEKLLLGALVPGMRGTVVGSYRRGLESSGDVDVLITMEGLTDKQRTAAFREYVVGLKSSGYMVEVLSEGGQKCLSVVRLPAVGAVARRLDLLVIPAEQFPFALLYFTGSGDFNVVFRKHALSLGYTLNEHEMKPTGKLEVSPVPPMTKEADIFAFLGLQYKEPHERVGASAVVLVTATVPAPVKGTRKAKVVKEKVVKEKVVKVKKTKAQDV